MNSESLEPNEKPFLRGRHRRPRFQFGNGDSPLSGYVIKRGLGIGGFGEVYHAQSSAGKNVAIKRIVNNVDIEMRGVRQCLNLRHPNLLSLFNIQVDEHDQAWVIMEMMEGESLRSKIDRSPKGISESEAEQLFAQLVAGITYLHDQGLVHRDLKPANIFIENGLVKVGDYGLSKFISASHRAGQTESVGTFHYMAPEIGHGNYGKEIDIYALGIIFFEMLTGDVPFDGESTQEIIVKHLSATPDLSVLPASKRALVDQCLRKNPVDRIRSGRELLTAMGWGLNSSGLAEKIGPDSPLPPPTTDVPPNPTVLVSDNVPKKELPVAKQIATPNYPSRMKTASPEAFETYRTTDQTQRGSKTSETHNTERNQQPVPINHYREPVARAIHELVAYYIGMLYSLNNPARTYATIATIAVLLIFFINGGFVLGVLGLCAYSAYYPFYFVCRNVLDGVAAFNESMNAEAPRKVLTDRDFPPLNKASSWQHKLNGVAISGLIWSIVIGCYLFVWKGVTNVEHLYEYLPALWLSLMTILTVWGIILLTPLGPATKKDPLSWLGWIGLLLLTLALTCVSTMLLAENQSFDSFELRKWFDTISNNEVLFGQQLAYFSFLLFTTNWRKLMSVYRTRKIRIWSIIYSSAIGLITLFLFDIKETWFFYAFPLTTLLVQLSIPSIGSLNKVNGALEGHHGE